MPSFLLILNNEDWALQYSKNKYAPASLTPIYQSISAGANYGWLIYSSELNFGPLPSLYCRKKSLHHRNRLWRGVSEELDISFRLEKTRLKGNKYESTFHIPGTISRTKKACLSQKTSIKSQEKCFQMNSQCSLTVETTINGNCKIFAGCV